jgi:hypothetical protein
MNTAGTDIAQVVADIVEELAGMPRLEVTPDKIFDRFEVEVEDDELKDIGTVGGILTAAEHCRVAASPVGLCTVSPCTRGSDRSSGGGNGQGRPPLEAPRHPSPFRAAPSIAPGNVAM